MCFNSLDYLSGTCGYILPQDQWQPHKSSWKEPDLNDSAGSKIIIGTDIVHLDGEDEHIEALLVHWTFKDWRA